MPKTEPPVRWAPRVQPGKIRRLYAHDAQGVLDEELIDDVGFALYSRCLSIIHVSDAMIGKVHCVQCDTIILCDARDADSVLRCQRCAWQAQWSDYANTYRGQELGAGGARDIFEEFVARWERVQAPREKMVLIDQLIHRWHWETRQERPSFGLGRPTGVNLIEGNRKQVLDFLDTLTYGVDSTPGTDATKATWQKHRQEVRTRQAENRDRHGVNNQPVDDEPS
jgi:hypothetical protein